MEDPRAELVRRLLEYQQMREVVDLLERLGEERRGRFARAYVPQQVAPPAAPLALSLAELLSAVDRVVRVAREPAIHDVVARPLDVDGAIATVRAVPRASWDSALARCLSPECPTVAGVVGTPRAVGAARRGELRLAQLCPFLQS